jgi:hypothetical protein
VDHAGEPGHLCDAELGDILAAEAAAEMDHRDPETLGEDRWLDRHRRWGRVPCRVRRTRNGHLLPLMARRMTIQITKLVYIVGK